MKPTVSTALILILLALGACSTFATSKSVQRITKEELRTMLGRPDVVIVDVRTNKDWTGSDLKIKGAVRETPEATESWANRYPKDKTFVFYCA